MKKTLLSVKCALLRFIYRKRTFTIRFHNYIPYIGELFDTAQERKVRYLGKGKYLTTKKKSLYESNQKHRRAKATRLTH